MPAVAFICHLRARWLCGTDAIRVLNADYLARKMSFFRAPSAAASCRCTRCSSGWRVVCIGERYFSCLCSSLPCAGWFGLWQWRVSRCIRTARGTRDTNQKTTQQASAGCGAAAPFVSVIALGRHARRRLNSTCREYHLQVPKEFYQYGRIDFLPHNVYGNMPLGARCSAWRPWPLTGDWWFGALVGKTVIALAAPLTALGLFAAGHVSSAPSPVSWRRLTYISIPWIVRVSTLGLIEGMSALYLWGTDLRRRALVARLTEAKTLPRLLLAGFLAGSAAACKYPNVLFCFLPGFSGGAPCARGGNRQRKLTAVTDDQGRPPSPGRMWPAMACFSL